MKYLWLLQQLKKLVKSRPEWSLLFRENTLRKGKDELHTWVIEPLDGVKNISHGIPYFSISIAAMNENEVVAGVIYDPLRDEMFVSEKGNGSFVNDKRLRVSARKKCNSCKKFCNKGGKQRILGAGPNPDPFLNVAILP